MAFISANFDVGVSCSFILCLKVSFMILFTRDLSKSCRWTTFPRNGWHSYWNKPCPITADLFLYSYENEFLDKRIKKGKRSFLESSIYHIVTLMILYLSIIKDSKSSFLIFTPKNSQFRKPQNLPQLLLISICFPPEIRATT